METDRAAEWLQNTRIHQESAQIALEMKAAGNWCLTAIVNVDMPRALAAIEAVLSDHPVIQLYEAADGCEHPEPQVDTDEHDGWAGSHPFGTTGERICLLSPFDRACGMCSEMVYGDEPTTEDYVSASGCHVRLAITAALAGKEAGDGLQARPRQ